MRKGQIILLILVAVIMLTVMILTWGSVGSAVCILCLITMGSALLFQRFLINRDSDQFDSE